MKVYKVKVNGRVFEVEVEAVEEKDTSIEKEERIENKTKVSVQGKQILAPIAGKVTDLKVNVGDSVKEGQTLMIIEAMKLENEIQSSYSGKIAQILVKEGDDVRNKDVLIILQ